MIYMIGGSGGPNFGDDLILSLWVRFYRENGYHGPIVVDCLGGQSSEKLHGKLEGVFFTSFIKDLAKGREGDFSYYIEKGRKFFLDSARDILLRLGFDESFAKVKLVHLYGGGYINGVWPNSGSLLGAVSQMRSQFGTPCVATGLGISPLGNLSSGEKTALSSAISSFDVFELRDSISYNEIVGFSGFSNRIIYGLDDTFLYPASDLSGKKKGSALHISGFTKSFSEWSSQQLGDFFSTCGSQFENVYFWVCNKSDVLAGDKIKQAYPALKKLTNNKLINTGMPVSSGDVMITARFHPHLLGARLGCQGYYLASSPFYKLKHKSVIDLGSPYLQTQSIAMDGAHRIQGTIVERESDLVVRKNLLAKYILASLL